MSQRCFKFENSLSPVICLRPLSGDFRISGKGEEGSAKSAKGDSELGLGERVGIAFSLGAVDNQTVTEHNEKRSTDIIY